MSVYTVMRAHCHKNRKRLLKNNAKVPQQISQYFQSYNPKCDEWVKQCSWIVGLREKHKKLVIIKVLFLNYYY